MAAVIRQMVAIYRYIQDLRDPRTADWFLASSPLPLISILIVYWYFVFRIGPNFMKNRQPFSLDKLLQIYNAMQVVACSYLVQQAWTIAYGPSGTYNWLCEPVDFSTDPSAVWTARLVHFYFLLKVLDLMDTVFFVLRKKQSQVTFLHVYHHMGMAALGWIGCVFLPGGHGVFLGFINSFVHALMYTYYFVTIWKPEYKENIWWKKHITQLQILQFLLLVLHHSALIVHTPCGFPRWVSLFIMPQFLFFLILFTDFYRKTYK